MSISDDELPELGELLGIPRLTVGGPILNSVRRSPRKKTKEDGCKVIQEELETIVKMTTSKQTQRSPNKRSPKKTTHTVAFTEFQPSKLGQVPSLSRNPPPFQATASSNNRSSPQHYSEPLHLLHVDSLLLPLSKLAINDTKQTRRARPTAATARSQASKAGDRFVLSEARCNDDEEESGAEEDEDDDTDLSGFIVGDDAELSYHEWSEHDSIQAKRKMGEESEKKPLRRLQRGWSQRPGLKPRHTQCSDEEGSDTGIANELRKLRFENKLGLQRKASIEIIDLTNSPDKDSRDQHAPSRSGGESGDDDDPFHMPSLLQRFNDALKLSPSRLEAFPIMPQKQQPSDKTDDPRATEKYTTPPNTPPRSPSKLRSLSKLRSPSKRDAVARSPHRQSTDGFWDLHTINSWNDQYSPKKVPAASPGKRGLARFQIWSDDSADEDPETTRSSSLPSPCASPTKPASLVKSPEKAERQRIIAERKAAKSRKIAFDGAKEQMALDLFNELDHCITSSKLSSLSASTGGVQIIWSKTLRSTAGRANWRRTVTKPTGSPIKGNKIPEGPGVKVEHFANVELAAKVIDSEDRLVNTLAHEFCHLANFMISNIRDQPHGASFKCWAKKVTAHLQKSDNELWRKVEVTTKHSYKIDHKYLWVCVGRERSKAAEFLNVEEDVGCGAEYGRHSKSIDTDKQRCGRCKGRLVQVRPKPRENPVKKTRSQENGRMGARGKMEIEEKIVEVVEVSD